MVTLGHHSEMIICALHRRVPVPALQGDCQIRKLDLHDPAGAFQLYVPLLSITFPKSHPDKAKGNSHSNLPFPEHLLWAALLFSFKTLISPRASTSPFYSESVSLPSSVQLNQWWKPGFKSGSNFKASS